MKLIQKVKRIVCFLIGMLRRSMSGNSGLNNLANSSGVVRRSERDGTGANANVSSGGADAAYRASLVSHYAEDLDRRRRVERAVEESRTDGSNSVFLCAHSKCNTFGVLLCILFLYL